MSPRARARREQVVRVGLPTLTLIITLLVAVFVVVPFVVAPSAADSASGRTAVVTRGSSLSLPGQRTPDLALQVGPGTPAGDSRVIRMDVQGRERGYLLLPALGVPQGEQAGLLVVLHQDVGSARAVAEGLGLDALRRRGVALAYPAGVGGSWNAGNCCGVAKDEGVDDVAFVTRVLDDVGQRVPIDPRRRGLLGYSGGGMLTYRVLCEARAELAAAVEVSGSLESTCAPGVALPDVLSVHGALDGTIGLTKPIRVSHLGIAPRTVHSTLTNMTTLGGCGDRTTTDAPGVRHVRWSSCRGGSSFEAQIVGDAGHGWDDIGAAARAMPFLLDRLATT